MHVQCVTTKQNWSFALENNSKKDTLWVGDENNNKKDTLWVGDENNNKKDTLWVGDENNNKKDTLWVGDYPLEVECDNHPEESNNNKTNRPLTPTWKRPQTARVIPYPPPPPPHTHTTNTWGGWGGSYRLDSNCSHKRSGEEEHYRSQHKSSGRGKKGRPLRLANWSIHHLVIALHYYHGCRPVLAVCPK